MNTDVSHVSDGDWVAFEGGELEGQRPKALCAACRARLKQAAATGSGPVRPSALCFECYRADIARGRAIRAAGVLPTGSEDRFQTQLPFEPVNHPRLQMLKAARAAAREASTAGVGQLEARRRAAQIAARRALHGAVASISARSVASVDGDRAIAAAVHAAELQLPESWLAFVVAR